MLRTEVDLFKSFSTSSSIIVLSDNSVIMVATSVIEK